MKFTVNTKPLSDALALGVVNANVSRFYSKSVIAQVKATRGELKINLEATSIMSEIRIKGSGDSDETASVLVDNMTLKQMVSTFDTNTIDLEFVEGGLILHSGKSKFTIPSMLDDADLELNSPNLPTDGTGFVLDVDKSSWKFIKDFQMYAIAMSYARPVYTRVWMSENGDVVVGDLDNSIFTHSTKGELGTTCLLTDTIINLFNSLPDGARMIKSGLSYIISVDTDSYEFTAEFKPDYESDEIGSYNSEIILDMLRRPEDNIVKISTAAINKLLSQADLLSSSTDDVVTLSVEGDTLLLKDKNVDGKIPLQGKCDSFSIDFKISLLKSVVGNYDDEFLSMSIIENDGEIVGILVWSEELTTVLAGVE